MVTIRPYFTKRERSRITATIPAGDREGRERALVAEAARVRTSWWEADLRFSFPDGTPFRRRLRIPFACGASNARRWAEERERAFVREGKRAAPPPARPAVPTLAEFAPAFVDASRAVANKASTSEAKLSILKIHLVPALGGYRLDAIDAAALASLQAALLGKNLTAKTSNNIRTVMRGVLKHARELGYIAAVPEIRLARVRPPEMLRYSDQEYARLLDAAAGLNARIHLAILLAGEAGLRLGEILALRWSDVNFARGTLIVARNFWRTVEDTPKGNKPHPLPMTARLRAALQAVPRRGPHVIEKNGHPVNARHLGLLMKAVTRLAGLTPTEGMHRLRHTYCSRLADCGAPPEAIRRLARHSTMAVTQRYLHTSDATLEHAVALLNR